MRTSVRRMQIWLLLGTALYFGWALFPYDNHVTFRKLGSGTGLQNIVTEETGRRGPVTWVKRKSTWIIGKIEGEWKILGLFVNCPNVPDEVAWSDWRIH